MKSSRTKSVIRFIPLYQDRVWGGRSLATLYGRQLPKEEVPYGESWEVCDREDAQSVVQGGPWDGRTLHDLWTEDRGAVFGWEAGKHPSLRFPLLIKILDAREDLSLQVHPNDETAPIVSGEAKSEAWYVTHTEPHSKLYMGFKPGVTKDDYTRSVADGSLVDLVQSRPVQAGDCLAIPGGLVHAIGAGLVIFEVQQNSDTTYRVFDWNRTGLDGKPRELHLEKAAQVTNFDSGPADLIRTSETKLLEWPFFKIHRWKLSKYEGRQVPWPGRFAIGAVAEGEVECAQEVFKAGDFFLAPACLEPDHRMVRTLSSSAAILWTTL